MKKTKIIYWIFTGLFCAFMLYSGISEIINGQQAKDVIHHLGYPDYLNPFIGVMKILGVIAILVPGYPRLTEWAYAGFFFDLFGATCSQIATDGFRPEITFMLVFFIIWAFSYIYWHKKTGASNVAGAK